MTDSESVSAILITQVEGVKPTADKKHALIKCLQETGQEIVLAIPHEQLLSFVEMFASGYTSIEGRGKLQSGLASYFPTEWWEIGTSTNPDGFVFSFQLRSGGVFRFYTARQAAKGIFDSLSVHFGEQANRKPENALN